MATRIRTLNFLPEVFKTTTNSQFLNATLDQVVDQPNLQKIQGYIGSKFGYGINASDYYVTEPDKTRTNYQLDPGVVFTVPNENTANDFITYPGINDTLKTYGGKVENNSRLYQNDFYSWDSYTNLDALINYNQYYWLPSGPPAVTVGSSVVYTNNDYVVTSLANDYTIAPQGSTSTVNPTLTLIRGGIYTFAVNQNSEFWIQGAPGVTGYDPLNPNVQTRNVYGVTNNGSSQGIVQFLVPYKTDQSQYDIPGNLEVDLVCNLPFTSIEGNLLNVIKNIDGVTSLAGKTIMFYDTGVNNETGYLGTYYDTTEYDQDGGVNYDPATYPGSSIYDNNFEGGYYTTVNQHFYTITYTGDITNPTLKLQPLSQIPVNTKITAKYGTTYGSLSFYLNNIGNIVELPYISATLDTLYYQDGTNPNKVGVIKLVDSNITNNINVVTDILGKNNYTSGNGVVFTNGLKVEFQNTVEPASYTTGQYYVQGVGTSIELVPVTDLIVPELTSEAIFTPYDVSAFDVGNFDSGLYIPVTPDYITIARNSIDRNAWSRSNRWFHLDVITATSTYNQDPTIVSTYATQDNKAKRPIIEFYPNLKLFKSGIFAKKPIDFYDNKTIDAFTEVAGHREYYPDTASYTAYTATISGVPSPVTGINILRTSNFGNTIKLGSGNTSQFAKNDIIILNNSIGGLSATYTYYIYEIIDSTTFQVTNEYNGNLLSLNYDTNSTTATYYPRHTNIIVNSSDINGSMVIGQYIKDCYVSPSTISVLPLSAQITGITNVGTTTNITVSWTSQITFNTVSNASLVTANTTLDNYQLFNGARIVFSQDSNPEVRNKIYTVELSSPTVGSNPVIMLTVASDGDVIADSNTVAFRGYNYAGYSFYFDGVNWNSAQTKKNVNQAPLFDVFDNFGVSLGDQTVYTSTSFAGTKLFSYSTGSGTKDSVLGFPIQYSSITDVGDINFNVALNSDTFNYVNGSTPVTENINIGYVYQYSMGQNQYVRSIGWQTAIAPSIQYQIFNKTYYSAINTNNSFTCDIELTTNTSISWPLIQVYINNVYQPGNNYSYVSANNQTIVTINSNIVLTEGTPVEILLISDQVSNTGYYQTPINLTNNPLNENLQTLNLGDIRGQYQSICYNNPNINGQIFGNNNFRDLGNLVPWGNRIIQNSASLVLPGIFLRKQNHNLFNALQYNSEQYINFKTLLINTVANTAYNSPQTPAFMLDDAINQITLNKSNTGSFFWSDMLPSKTPYISNTYTFNNNLDVSIYPLSTVYDYTSANYNGVLVYLTRNNIITQLIKNVDYVISLLNPTLTINYSLLPGDTITVNEYNQTYGSYVPNTPTKLGLYPATIPQVFLDSNYLIPTYFIVGHDGSFTQLYGDYDPTTNTLNDSRDQVLLEFETRIYNNLKLSNTVPIQEYEIVPGFFRNNEYTNEEWLEMYSESFLNWVGQNRIDYKTQFYNRNNEFTFNYRDNSYKLDNSPINIGYWRGLYQYFYDTTTPNLTPWEMIGYRNMPTWWENRYGPAPYTSDNMMLWDDMMNGIDYNDGNPVVRSQYVRNGLTDVIPVDDQGNLLSPFRCLLGNYNGLSFQKDWIIGDDGPSEFAFRRSSSYPFTLMRLMALMMPAKFFNLAVDVDNYKYNIEFNQYLVNNRSHLTLKDIKIYGSGTPVTSYINWIVDYEKQVGIDTTSQLQTLLNNVDVRLVHRLAGFSDKEQLRFYVEKGSPNSTNASLLIPDESYSILLYNNQPTDTIYFSSLIIQITDRGYKVYGNSQTKAYFTISVPKVGKTNTITIDNLSVQTPEVFYDTTVDVPYGTMFYTPQEVANFIVSYGNYLKTQGVIFQEVQQGLEITWNQMVAEFLYWDQTGWDVGSIITLNPSAQRLEINKENNVVQPLVLRNQNFILNQNLMPISLNNLNINRDGTDFIVETINEGDTISYSQFDVGSIEHGIVFDNQTLFNDTIYTPVTGLRQNRIYVRGTKSAEWDGTMTAQGFILNQDNIQNWDGTVKYTKGSIVLYKNRYWSATEIIQPSDKFDETKWQVTNYNDIQKGLLPNSSTNSYESTLYYDINQANLKNDADLLSFSLIGYRPRDYLAVADLTDITQVNVYQNLIKNKGTLNAASAFKGANLPQGGIDYTINENWAIQTGSFGGTLNNNFIEIGLSEKQLPNNPSTIALTNGYNDINADMEVPLYKIYNYQRPITSPDILETLPTNTPSVTFGDAGYVNYQDVKLASYSYSGLANGTNQYGTKVPLSQLYVGDYVWLANYREKWQALSPISLGPIVLAQNNLNKTVTITFKNPHNLEQYQPFAINNFNSNIDGYYVVAAVVNTTKVIINLVLDPSITSISGLGIGFKFQSQRVSTPSGISSLPLLSTEFTNNTVWVDTNDTGSWAVYQKNINYNFVNEFTEYDASSFGSSVAYTDKLGYLIGDSGLGIVNRYTYIENTNTYEVRQTLSGGNSFGSYISYSDDIFVISEPVNGKVYIYQLVTTLQVDQLNLLQTINTDIISNTYGVSTAISGDKNWLYIVDSMNNRVLMFRKNQYSGVYENRGSTSVSSPDVGVVTSVATDYYGETLILGNPTSTINGLVNVGKTYIYNRVIENVEATYNSQQFLPQQFNLPYVPSTQVGYATATSHTTNYITINGGVPSNVKVGCPVVFSGSLLNPGILKANTVYYVSSIDNTNTYITVSATLNGPTLHLVDQSVVIGNAMVCNFQIEQLFVSVNGTILDNSQYGTVGSIFNVYYSLQAGDIVSISTCNLLLVQTIDSQIEYNIGEQFGTSVATNTYASEILVGAPFALDLTHDANQEGAVFRYTNGGNKYGMIIGTTPCQTTLGRTILLNGYGVFIPANSNATAVANLINSANITNITATNSNGLLVIALIDNNLSIPNKKLTIQVVSTYNDPNVAFAELGIQPYTQTQVIVCPHNELHSKFGTVINYNEQGSFVTSATAGNRYQATTFDYNSTNIDVDTIFDNNTTGFLDTFTNAGAVYMFDFVDEYNGSLLNPGKYIYAQSLNSEMLTYGSQPYYGTALDFNNYQVVIGTPNFEPAVTNGLVTIYQNTTGQKNWSVYRESGDIVDINKIQNAQIYSLSTDNTLVNLDYIDPLQGKILGAARQNIDFISNADPASYNSQFSTPGAVTWGADKVGTLWLDTSNIRFINYHQQDYNYNNKWWGKVFPGSDVAVYSFITSNVVPSLYTGPGTPYNIDSYTVQYLPNQSNTATPVYYYWVRNSNIVFYQTGKTLSDTIIESYITNPQNTGISYFTPVSSNAFSLYNSLEYINNIDSVFHLGYATGSGSTLPHTQFTLIKAGNSDSFLPGLPSESPSHEPSSLYEKLLDSVGGLDRAGAVVPDPLLPLPVQSGVLSRPRQSLFVDRLSALENIIISVNDILMQYPFNELLNSKFLYEVGPINPSTGMPFYSVSDYVLNVNWWANGYSDSTKATIQVPIYADLATLNVEPGTIVSVAKNGVGLQETYIYNNDGTFTRIGLQYGTLQIANSIYDYNDSHVGFGNNFFDTDTFDYFPSEPAKYILRALCEELPPDLFLLRNQILINIFEYIVSESNGNQNYLPWLNKTSFIDVEHTIRELLPLRVYQSDNETFLEGYLNEVKPYHVVIKNFLFKYTGVDSFGGDLSDFDLPAAYMPQSQQFITPELVYSTPTDVNQFTLSDSIWQNGNYSQWYNNYGVSITGQNNYYITNVKTYLALNTTVFEVDNASGFPVNGVIYIGSECIAYSQVDRLNNIISGLTRGFNGTTISNHIPGEKVYIDLPAALVLYGGRGYSEPPKVTAVIDTSIYPAPKEQAVFTATLTIDTIQSITVNNPGYGYPVLPEIVIDPAFTLTFNESSVTVNTNTIQLDQNLLQTGDILKYNIINGSTKIEGLELNQYYYVNVLETTPLVSIALYTSLRDCYNDQNRVKLYTTGLGNQTLSLGAIATCISIAAPIRENNIALKFDRTTYNSQISDWSSSGFYGSFYAGEFNYTLAGASSSIKLEGTDPNITKILTSAGGATFEIVNVANTQAINFSSRSRTVLQTYGPANISYPNTIQISPSPGGASVSGFVGSTVGFTIGMPIKFEGAAFSNIVIDQIYYVESLVSIAGQNTGFRIATSYSNAINGIPLTLTDATVPSAGMLAYPSEVDNQAILTIDYPGIRKATATNSINNSITIPLTPTGHGGTIGFYRGMMLFFVGSVFGGLVENELYYVTSVIDNQTFTISSKQTPITTKVYAVLNGTDPSFPNSVSVGSNVEFNINDPVMFDPFTVTDSSGNISTYNTFGGIVAGQLYYIASQLGAGHVQLSNAPNSSPITLTAFSPVINSFTYSTMVSQKNCIQLVTAHGSVNAEINLPVSPGQITGQEFTLYKTSSYFNPNNIEESGYSNLFSEAVEYVIGKPYSTTVNRVMLEETKMSNIYQVYNNMPIQVSQNIGGLTTGTTYYVIDSGNSTVTVTNSSSSNYLTTTDTSYIYPGMPIIFSGYSMGGVLIGVTYYVLSIISSTQFTITNTQVGGSPFTLYNDSGTMVGTGSVYLSLSSTPGGTSVTLTSAAPTVSTNLTQYPTHDEQIAVRYVLGGYDAYIVSGGSGYAVGNSLMITGDQLGGTTPANDLLMTVNSIDSNGAITSFLRTGNPAGSSKKYYLKAIDENQMAVYSNSNMTIPVSGLNFNFTGDTIVSVLTSNSSSDTLTISDITGFNQFDPVVFTGNVSGGLVSGQTYYLVNSPVSVSVSGYPNAGTIQVSTTLAGTVLDITANGINCTMAKYGDFILLPEPFYFNQSVVKFKDQIWRCVVSNNDKDFIFGKWELLQSGDRLLNAMDRTIGYYQPTNNMPGVDLTQLYNGVTYPNSVYKANAFAPDQEYPLDVILNDSPFYPTNISVVDIVWNGTTYIATCNSYENSLNLILTPSNNSTPTWNIVNLTNKVIGVNSISYYPTVGKYIITTANQVTPLLLSNDGLEFNYETGLGWITNGDYTPFDYVPFEDTNYDVTGVQVASSSLYSSTYNNGLYISVGNNIVVSIDGYTYQVAYTPNNNRSVILKQVKYFNLSNFVGYITVGSITNLTNSVTNEIILTSQDGYNWNNPLTSIYGNNSFNSIADDGSNLVVVGDNGVIYTSPNGSNYFPKTSGVNTNLNKIIYNNGLFVAVGDNGVILTSTNANTWTKKSSGVSQNLHSIIYNSDNNVYVVVGDNNTILQSVDTNNWTSVAVFTPTNSTYTLKGDNFTAGYGPEELVSGVVKDNLSMFVNTRPGTNWDETVYQHVGYDTVSLEFKPTNEIQTTYSFKNAVPVPAQIKVFVINGSTNLSTTLYPSNYSVDWINSKVILNTPLALTNRLRIDVYAVGNGDQLVKSNSLIDPIRKNTVTGYNEIYLNCNYSAPIYSGSGIIKPGTQSIDTFAFETRSSDNSILVQDITHFVANSPITFLGNLFGGVIEFNPDGSKKTYYVKTISHATSRITISEFYNLGIAGPTFQLTDATGEMDVEIQLQNGTTWTDPVVYHNGTKLLPGHFLTVTKTNAGSNTIEVNSTNALIIGETVVFSETLFPGTGLNPGQVYYISSIPTSLTFTVSLTLGGPTLNLNNSSGGSYAIVADYAFGIQENGISAKLILAGKPDLSNPGYLMPYDQSIDYLTFTLFGQTIPAQYGYTIPDTQFITPDGSSVTYPLTNYINVDNQLNAIVEIDGVRKDYSTDYTIDVPTSTITFTSTPSSSSTISVTTYNLTDRQYLYTQYGITGKTVSSITSVNNTITNLQAAAIASSVSGSNITVSNTIGINVGATVLFQGTSFGNIKTDGTVYYIASASGTTITISATPGGPAITNWTTASGAMQVQVGGQPAVRVTTSTPHGFASPTNNNNLVRIDGTLGSVQLNNNLYYVHVINAYTVDLYTQPYTVGINAINYPLTAISSYVSGGYIWNLGSFILSDTTVTATDSITKLVTVGNTEGFIVNTPIVFNQSGTPIGSNLIGGIMSGQTYYVAEISSATTLRISQTQGGSIYGVSTASASGNPILLSQWQQTNVDRLYVTVDGHRVPSSSLRVNTGNFVSILSPISSSQKITITSMIPSATPYAQTYVQTVNSSGVSDVYRLTEDTTTWLTKQLLPTSTEIYVDNASKLVQTVVQNSVAPIPDNYPVNRLFNIGLNVDKTLISSISVLNTTTNVVLNTSSYKLESVNLAPTLVISDQVNIGDNLKITILLGNTVYISGERIRFTTVDLVANTLSGLQRGVEGTGIQSNLGVFTPVISVLSSNKLPVAFYNQTWNSDNYNVTLGDPLQISNTYSGGFLNQGES